MSSSIDCRRPRIVRGYVRKSLALVAALACMSSFAEGKDSAARTVAECSQPAIRVGSLSESALFLNTSSVRDANRSSPTVHATLHERADLLVRDARYDAAYVESARTTVERGAPDAWALIVGFVLLIAFAGMRRRQLFRDG